MAVVTNVNDSQISVASGKLLTCSNTLTISATDSSSVNFGGGGTISYAPQTAISCRVGFGTVTNVEKYPTTPIAIDSVGVTWWTVYAPTGSTWKTRLAVSTAVAAGQTLTLQCYRAPTVNDTYSALGSAITRVEADGTAVVESATLSPTAGYLIIGIVYTDAGGLLAQCYMELMRLS